MKFSAIFTSIVTVLSATVYAQTEPPDPTDPCKTCDDKFISCKNSWGCWVPGSNCDYSCNRDVCANYPECNHKCGYNEC
ncbi:hypothetical protein K504DRAFT_461187 [Pleomassaria siparia CBS 279.74]|uniref:Carbohydrate-binding module family 18 protein n=1 Tax=Pleomassaria siparia CBS 279.74 TaxID=1314801 RepID=A0A6G1JUZ1_9PLEO|nr:hypothetical protein K504DRAFT_461187 [Pleomassaria siparia CBS 279.74]